MVGFTCMHTLYVSWFQCSLVPCLVAYQSVQVVYCSSLGLADVATCCMLLHSVHVVQVPVPAAHHSVKAVYCLSQRLACSKCGMHAGLGYSRRAVRVLPALLYSVTAVCCVSWGFSFGTQCMQRYLYVYVGCFCLLADSLVAELYMACMGNFYGLHGKYE